ncbi:death domain-containing protein 1-like isoform X1 [Physella acuta]|uniref:death domain-containing protein 1-like isoform X1 n=1 Tax=Physella acuta TaxID=109671 RepID=UPI0027DB45E1|nr:death domain-containing protein 1-like isoform X1 [Physella acuta]
MPSETKGHGSLANHGHGHKPGQEHEPSSNRKQVKGHAVTPKAKKTKPQDKKDKKDDEPSSTYNGEAAVMHANNETIIVPCESRDPEDEGHHGSEAREDDVGGRREEIRESPREKREYKRSSVTPSNFNVREFNSNMGEFIRTLDDPRYSQVDLDYPVDDLVSVVGMVTKSVNDYRMHTSDTQDQLEHLRDTMRNIRENLHFSVTRQAMDLRTDETNQTQEERDLHAKLAHLNAALAQANADVTEALRLATETQSTAVKANLAAEKAKEETRRIQEEIEKREKAEQKRKEEESRRNEEQRRQKEEQERRLQEETKRKEEEWKRREAQQGDKSSHTFDSWTPIEYEHVNEHGETEVTCIARGQPGSVDKHSFQCHVASEKEALVTYLPNEELISNVVDLTSPSGEEELKSPVYVAIPHVLTRTSAQSREAVVKAMVEGEWRDLPTRDVTFDSHKDIKFAQAEVRHLTTLIVMSRFKRDYVTLAPNKSHKLTSSFDQRITLTLDKDTLTKKEHFLLQVQPVDTATVQEYRAREPSGKGLLTSSSIVYTQWETTSFKKQIQITLPCPPNPAKAKKMALARKLKEEKMKQPIKPQVNIEDQQRENKREKKVVQEYNEAETSPAKVTKWYMGEYGNTDDDETDKLHLVYMQAGRWALEPAVTFKQLKVDVLGFSLDYPVERFMVLRTRTTVTDDVVLNIVTGLNDSLGKRFVEAVIRQKTDNPFEVALQVTPVSRLDTVVKHLAQRGFESGPAPSHVLCLHEGDLIEVGFSGNIECSDEVPETLIYKSNVPTVAFFTVREENRFRQKDHDVYSGLVSLTRKFMATPQKGRKGQDDTEQREWRREQLCTLQINIPKYHIEPNTEPLRAPVHAVEAQGPIDKDLLMDIADQLGDEWKKVAHHLGVHRARVQAIVRNVTVGERPGREAKYEMLVTWIKSAAKALDKVSVLSAALVNSDRYDLAETVKERGREFNGYRQGHMTAVN